ncbi:HlyD family type I secretion periplasmic adaptor subunit [Xanthobacter sp. YC-JY1]|uniref:HlyD family type I secretion periplasmic adaptor subunit n=1 Tax=Xanthobacter sp. YC-JY1 TaxID=2419844 RepID=UPI001F01B0C4|nr:HlyD family type I secretion periplasmic adaptor subunit [Xanthobacter sp. YC-JY1]UJX44862.1 HlyD family type I secretion periplasmic adaptor subunit [Xanthobacter sp. YC-JY1]
MTSPAFPDRPFAGASPRPPSGYRSVALLGYALIAVTFLGFGGWAAMARVDGAVVAPGVIGVESKRQVVQHLEGGIVAAILVQEGQTVRRDETLFRLDPTQSRANDEAALAQRRAALALEARLVAERDDAPAITFPPELLELARVPAVREAMADQIAQFRDRRAAFQSQIDILNGRIVQFGHELEGLAQERASARQQLAFVEDELTAVRELERKHLVNKSRVSSLEREKARLDGLVGRNIADEAKARGSIGEQKMQIVQLTQQRAEDVGSQLLDIREKLAELKEKVQVTRSVLERIDIRAPSGGIVQNINPRIYTVGAVVRPGDTLLEIVPVDAPLVVEARVPVQDIDRLDLHEAVEVRFPAFHGRTTPMVLGHLASVSRDRLVDETTHQPYFLARVGVDETDVPADLRSRLQPGMDAEVAFHTGSRTVMSYLLRPLADAMARAFTER